MSVARLLVVREALRKVQIRISPFMKVKAKRRIMRKPV
jgi:hypothetical protein